MADKIRMRTAAAADHSHISAAATATDIAFGNHTEYPPNNNNGFNGLKPDRHHDL